MDPRLSQDDYRRIWESKPVVRSVYTQYFDRIATECVNGMTLEIGGGSGNLKSRLRHVISSDIEPSQWVDLAADAHALPIRDTSVDNLVGLDTLHHIEFPTRLFSEAERVIRAGGRLVFIEPAITPASWFVYRWLHPEPVVMKADPLIDGIPDPMRPPFESNQAIPTLLTRQVDRLSQKHPNLTLVSVRWLSLWVYPLSGGFQRWSLIPTPLARPLLRIERVIERWLGRLLGFRLILVFERS